MTLEQMGLGESFGKASSANTAFGSSRFIPMQTGIPVLSKVGYVIHLKHGRMKPWSRPLAKKRKN
jgi:hypothetical protein